MSAELSAATSVAISCGDDGDDDHQNAGGNDDDDDDDDEEGREVIYVSNKGTSAGVGEVLRIER